MASDELRKAMMRQLTEELCDREGKKAENSGVLEAYDLVSVFAASAALVAARFKSFDKEFADQLGGNAIRTLLKTLELNGVEPTL